MAKAKDQLLPLFVMDTFQGYPGAAGVFVAGIFSAALSSLSSALNALAAIAFEDFCKPYFGNTLSESQIGYILRGSVLLFGAVSVVFIYIVEHLGAVMQLTMTLSSTSGGPLFGLFVMGIFMPWVNATVGHILMSSQLKNIKVFSNYRALCTEVWPAFARWPICASGRRHR